MNIDVALLLLLLLGALVAAPALQIIVRADQKTPHPRCPVPLRRLTDDEVIPGSRTNT
ncbi:hypothetical protein [Rhodococcus globerulus]|uniref:Uncharacterized protein n=1 Tax=Rhodococcus globerulus TaxID=33008 RepID=A0ABU4C5H4_RHOGO|nr:hypothetical protein [Rhodococcus globerulus]MDV6271608.1 hypothetical protein [Rhodococcus globerulus]